MAHYKTPPTFAEGKKGDTYEHEGKHFIIADISENGNWYVSQMEVVQPPEPPADPSTLPLDKILIFCETDIYMGAVFLALKWPLDFFDGQDARNRLRYVQPEGNACIWSEPGNTRTIVSAQDWLSWQKREVKVWVPEIGQEYWFVTNDERKVDSLSYNNHHIDFYFILAGNCFHTREAALEALPAFVKRIEALTKK